MRNVVIHNGARVLSDEVRTAANAIVLAHKDGSGTIEKNRDNGGTGWRDKDEINKFIHEQLFG